MSSTASGFGHFLSHPYRSLVPSKATSSSQESLHSSTCVVHVEYDINNPPPKPSSSNSDSNQQKVKQRQDWTRFVCISDTHAHTFPVPDGDVLLHSGDLTNTGRLEDFEKTVEWICGMGHRKKIIIAGNHDLTLHRGWYDDNWQRWHRDGKEDIEPILSLLKGPKAKAANLVYLQDEEYQFQVKEDGRMWSVYGSPWSPEFWNWAFNYDPGEEAERIVSKFPKTDILLTHGPPHRILDITTRGDYPGCLILAARLPKLRPRIHLFGHIHEAHGAYIHQWPRISSDNKEGSSDFGRCPKVQNDSYGGVEDAALSSNASPSDANQDDSDATTSSEEAEEPDRTAFVNAANWPMGQRSLKYGVKKQVTVPSAGNPSMKSTYTKMVAEFGGRGFLPVIVDLLD